MTEHSNLCCRWYIVVNDLIGGWDVATVDKPSSQIDYRHTSVEHGIAWGLSREEAEHIVLLHNVWWRTHHAECVPNKVNI